MGILGTLLDLDRVLLSSVSALTCLLGLDLDLERDEVVDTEDILDKIELLSNPCVGVEEVDGVGSKEVVELLVAAVLREDRMEETAREVEDLGLSEVTGGRTAEAAAG